MHNPSATLKKIRPFQTPPYKEQADQRFISWQQKSWEKLIVEIGCGAGLHPIRYAQQNPKEAIVALERTKTKFNSFEQRLSHHQLPNIYPINKDALYWLPSNLTKKSVHEFFFLYPNPYPKEKQANKRWHRNPFFEYILDCLKPQGLVHFASNEKDYINECENYCINHWKLKLIKSSQLTEDTNDQYRTHFEKKYLKRQQTCFDLVFQKN